MLALLIVVCALPLPVGGQRVQWVDDLGIVRTATPAAVLEDAATRIRFKDGEGKVQTVPAAALLDFVREDVRVELQKTLLQARRCAVAGHRVEEASAALDRILPRTEGWTREYALAARAICAERLGHKDAARRLATHLRDYPHSRFFGEVSLAAVRLESRGMTSVQKAAGHFLFARRKLDESGVLTPACRLRFQREGYRHIVAMKPDAMNEASVRIRNDLERRYATAANAREKVLSAAAVRWFRLDHLLLDRMQRERESNKLEPLLAEFRVLFRESERSLGEVRVDVRLGWAETLAKCGKKQEAAEQFRLAEKEAPDLVRRARARAGIRALK